MSRKKRFTNAQLQSKSFYPHNDSNIPLVLHFSQSVPIALTQIFIWCSVKLSLLGETHLSLSP
jgi:hypothetical protein